MVAPKKISLNRRKVTEQILQDRGDTLFVTGLGSTTWDAAAAGDHPNNFYLWGGMGGAAMTGLGLARVRAERRHPPTQVVDGFGDPRGVDAGHDAHDLEGGGSGRVVEDDAVPQLLEVWRRRR